MFRKKKKKTISVVFMFQDNPEDISTIDSCEYIWESGVGFAHSPPHNSIQDQNRTELLKLCLTCFSETMYLPPVGELASNKLCFWW